MADRDFTVTVQIDAPPERVWDILNDLAAWPTWTSSMTSVQPSASGPLAVGMSARIKQPKMPALTWTITDVVPGERFTWSSRSLGVTTTATHALRADGAGTAVELTVTQAGLLAPLLQLLGGARGRRYVETEAAGLKQAAETSS